MSGRFDKFFDYAYEKGRDIAKKFHGNKGDKMDKKGMNIESYDGQDAFYTGTDEEYEEFLKNVDVKTDNDADAEPVENTQRINLNETINIQSVIDKFKKKAGDIENGARKFKDTVVSKVDEFKAKKEAENTTEAANEKEEKKKDNSFEKVVKTAEDIKEDIKNAVDESGIKEKVKNTVKNSVEKIDNKLDNIRESVVSVSEMSDRFDDVESKIQNVSEDIDGLKSKIKDISEKLNIIDVQDNERMKEHKDNYSEIKNSVDEIAKSVSEVKQAFNSISKLNDRVFDLKNTQLNTKNTISELELSFVKLKKKCVLGVTVLSILSAIVIVLEVVLMLS